MAELRVCVRFESCSGDYYDLAMKARPFSELLQRVEFIEPGYRIGYAGLEADITVLVPPDMVRRWASIDDTIAMEHMGEQILYMEIMRVCEREKILTQEELYG